jgi:outer membrane protein assembly factor BamA
MNLIPYIEDPRQGLGGLRTMRGFQQDRFVGPVMLLGNLELRWTFVRFVVAKQKLALIAVPFFDLGTVADRLGAVRHDGWRWNAGGALRISWNLATLLTIDYGQSHEDSGLFVNFNHIF